MASVGLNAANKSLFAGLGDRVTIASGPNGNTVTIPAGGNFTQEHKIENVTDENAVAIHGAVSSSANDDTLNAALTDAGLNATANADGSVSH